MYVHPIRKFLRRLGLDVHRYRAAPSIEDWIRSYGIRTAIDIGANTGQFADEIRYLFPAVPVHAFEPVPACVKALEAKAAHDPKLFVYPYAIGDAKDTVSMRVNRYTPASSILPIGKAHLASFPKATPEETVEVEVKRLDDVDFKAPITEPLLINVDVQGFEAKVLAGGEHTFRRAALVIMECSFVELYEGQARFPELLTEMQKLGFAYRGALRQKIDPKTGAPLFEDSLFVRV